MRAGLIRAAVMAVVCLAGCAPVDLPSAGEGNGALTSFGILAPPVQGRIAAGARTIDVDLPHGTNLAALVAVFVSTGARVTVAGVEQESGRTPNDFSRPVEYIVESADGSSLSYVVHAVAAPPLGQDKEITGFSFVKPAVSGTIDESRRAISATVPHGTDLSSLVAVFVTTGVSVTVDDTEQVSGTTINDFTEPLTYTVTAADGSTAGYVVDVRQEPSAEKRLISFSLLCPGAAAVVDEEHKVVHARVAEGTLLSSLVAVFTTSGVSVRVSGRTQESGITANDFSGPVEYEVIAQDGTAAAYRVEVVGRIGLLLNELDVDQVGTDNAEFIELLASEDVDLCGVAVVLVNGGVTPGQEYARIDLSSLGCLPRGSFIVLGGPLVQVSPDAVKYTPTGWGSSNRIQNGPSDAVILWDTIGHKVIDTVSYAGVLHRAVIADEPGEVDATEGEAGEPADSNSSPGSLARTPNGQDTGQNGADFRFAPVPTPGGPNP